MVVREDRKEQIIDKAVGVFAEQGYYKATTALVAKAAGVTQPYVFHFFASKEELFKAVVDRAVNRIYETFAGIEAPADRLEETMGMAFVSIMNVHRDEILLVMQAYTIAEPVIREHVRDKFASHSQGDNRQVPRGPYSERGRGGKPVHRNRLAHYAIGSIEFASIALFQISG